MKTVYTVFMFNGMNWVKECNANEYFVKDTDIQDELNHLEQVWSHLNTLLAISSFTVDDGYVLPKHKEMPSLPKKTAWGTISQFQ